MKWCYFLMTKLDFKIGTMLPNVPNAIFAPLFVLQTNQHGVTKRKDD